MTFTHALSTNNYGPAKFIVDSNAANGTHTTIQSAITAASSGDTVFIRPGTYTENLTLKAGVNLYAYGSGGNNVIVIGKLTYTGGANVSINGLFLQTNSDYFLVFSGTSAGSVTLTSCFLYASNNTGISFTNSNASSQISIQKCNGDIATTGIAFFTVSGGGLLSFLGSSFGNTGNSTTASTVSGSSVFISNSSYISFPVSVSDTAQIGGSYNAFGFGNYVGLTLTSTTPCFLQYSYFLGGTSSAISIGSGASLTVDHATVSSSNASALTGAGTIKYGLIVYNGSSSTNSVTTQTDLSIQPPIPTGFPITLSFGGGSTGITYSANQGYYSKIGNLVFFSFILTLTNKGSSTGDAVINGLPFTVGTVSQFINIGYIEGLTFSLTNTLATAGPGLGTTQIFLYQGNGSTTSTLTDANFNNNTSLRMQGFYYL